MPIALYPAGVGLGQGDSGGIAIGTGLSVPGGVESTFEFNNLLMNYRHWYDTYIVTEITGLSDADVRDAREVNQAFHGETSFDSLYGGRTITMSGRIRAYTLPKLRDLIAAIRAAFGDLQEHPLIIRSGNPDTDVQIFCKKYQSLSIVEAQNNLLHERAFQIALRASDPFIMGFHEVYALVAANPVPASYTLYNNGNFEARAKYRLAGALTSPVTLTNLTTGKAIQLALTISAGNYVEFDTRKRTIVDQAGVNQFGKVSVSSDWPTLAPGPNLIQVTAAGSAAGATLQTWWSHTYI